MNKPSNFKGKGSILERAAALYDLGVGAAAPRPEAAEPADQALAPDVPPVWPIAAPPSEFPRGAASSNRRVSIDRPLLRQHGLVDPDGPISGLAEEFRIIKRQLLLGTKGGTGIDETKRQNILVCSAQPDEGKTYCAVNLALSMAVEKDIEVLLIDADFANPNIPALLGVKAGVGLTDAIADPGRDVNRLVIQTDIGSLSVLPAGRQANNVTELIASARTSEVLRALALNHPRRVLIFDSPPALVASPASVLASHAGQVMMVVRADRTTEADLREAVTLLSACDSISLVLNRASLAVGGRRFGSYYGQSE